MMKELALTLCSAFGGSGALGIAFAATTETNEENRVLLLYRVCLCM